MSYPCEHATMKKKEMRKDEPQPRRLSFAERWPTYEPTPAEIEAACVEIQATWSARERRKRIRSDLQRTPVSIPEIATSSLRLRDLRIREAS